MEKRCPACGKKYKKGSTFLRVLAAFLIVIVLLIAGCVALIGVGANEVADELDRQQNENAITQQEFRSIELGTAQDDVEERFGPPADSQEFESEGIITEEPANSSCIYYNREGGQFGDIFQLCFDESQLTAKNSY